MGASTDGPLNLEIPMPGAELAQGPERMAGEAMGVGKDSGLEEQASRGYGTGIGTKSPRSKYLAEGSGQKFG